MTRTLAELFEKRAELAGEIIQAEKRVRDLRIDLVQVEAAIRILRPGAELEKVVPRHVEYRPRYFKRGALMRLILDYLRQHVGEELPVADLMPTVIRDRNLTAVEYNRVATVTYEALNRLAKHDTVMRVGAGVKAARFQLITR